MHLFSFFLLGLIIMLALLLARLVIMLLIAVVMLPFILGGWIWEKLRG